MTAWLDPVARALDARPQPLRVFVRDDDAGWCHTRLFELLDVFEREQFPVDLAVIPAAIDARLVTELTARAAVSPIRLHQHGFRHTNHESTGRKCEFGGARDAAAQRADVESGRRMLLEHFGDLVDPIFTPPWNRCSEVTARCLRDMRLTLSRDSTAGTFDLEGLTECPVHVDWFAKRSQQRLSQVEWADCCAARIRHSAGVLGVMLHHAVMDDAEQRSWSEVLRLLARHGNVTGVLMRGVATDLQTRRAS